MESQNAQEDDLWRTERKGEYHVNPDSQGIAAQDSQVIGGECERVSGAMGEGGRCVSRAETIGGIYRQLRELQDSHLAYVHSHKERLEARLQIAKNYEENVTNKIQQLEQEVLRLLSEISDQEE